MIVDAHPHPGAAVSALGRPSAWALAAGALLVTGGLAGCGSSPEARSPAHRSSPDAARSRAGLLAVPGSTQTPAGVRPCPYQVAAALGAVAEQIYGESASGPNARQAVARVARAPGLAAAVARGDRAAVRAIAARLTAARIAALEVLRGPHLLADSGAMAALAPVGAPLSDSGGHPVGSFALSVQSVRAYAGITQAVTGARVLVRAGRRLLAGPVGVRPASIPDRGPVRFRGRAYQAYSFAGRALPPTPVRISLLIPRSAYSGCAPTAADTEARVLEGVGRRIYAGELRGPGVTRALHAVSASAPLGRAVARHDAAAARAALGALLNNHEHIVRLRVSWPGQTPIDVGGPTVLAPVATALPAGRGRRSARVELSIQDDHGYVLLAHSFTGADVLVRQGARQIEGTLNPGPARVPDRGPIVYRGARYLAYSFSAGAFPSGVLRISLLYRLS